MVGSRPKKFGNDLTQRLKIVCLDLCCAFPYMMDPLGRRVMKYDEIALENLLPYIFLISFLTEDAIK